METSDKHPEVRGLRGAMRRRPRARASPASEPHSHIKTILEINMSLSDSDNDFPSSRHRRNKDLILIISSSIFPCLIFSHCKGQGGLEEGQRRKRREARQMCS